MFMIFMISAVFAVTQGAVTDVPLDLENFAHESVVLSDNTDVALDQLSVEFDYLSCDCEDIEWNVYAIPVGIIMSEGASAIEGREPFYWRSLNKPNLYGLATNSNKPVLNYPNSIRDLMLASSGGLSGMRG